MNKREKWRSVYSLNQDVFFAHDACTILRRRAHNFRLRYTKVDFVPFVQRYEKRTLMYNLSPPLLIYHTPISAYLWELLAASNLARTQRFQPQFLAEFTMSFDDDSRIVVKEGQPPPPATPSRPASSSKREAQKSTAPSHGIGGKPDGFGTVICVQTFPTGLVVSTGSNGTVSRGGEGRESALWSCFSCFFCVGVVRGGACCCSKLDNRSNLSLTRVDELPVGYEGTLSITNFIRPIISIKILFGRVHMFCERDQFQMFP